MWPYWLLFIFPAILALTARRRLPSSITGLHSIRLNGWWLIAIVFFTVVIGLRSEVGADWNAYLEFLYRAETSSLVEVLQLHDPGYQLANWLSARTGWGIAGVNLICGLIFSFGLAIFCQSMPRPLLAMTVAVPYMLIVVAMGYSRQGMALGFAMVGLVALGRRNNIGFVTCVLLAATCHKSALLLLPISALASTQNRYWTAIWVGTIGFLSYFVLLEDHVEALFYTYIESEYKSQGAYIRLAMNAVPAIMLLTLHKRFSLAESEAPTLALVCRDFIGDSTVVVHCALDHCSGQSGAVYIGRYKY